MWFENQTILSYSPLHGVPDSQNCPFLISRCPGAHWCSESVTAALPVLGLFWSPIQVEVFQSGDLDFSMQRFRFHSLWWRGCWTPGRWTKDQVCQVNSLLTMIHWKPLITKSKKLTLLQHTTHNSHVHTGTFRVVWGWSRAELFTLFYARNLTLTLT